jgi:c-di-GMP-binding flagellar brake protein YcgR
MLDTLYQFVKVLEYSLKTHGYFEKGKVKNNSFDGKVIDISASGLLFLYLHSDLSAALKPESKLTVKLTTPQRIIETEAVIVRCFTDSSFDYYGCQFEKMKAEDHNYLFEYIYGKPLVASYDSSLSKQV